MSLRAITWALEEAPVQDPTALLVLIALADRASSDGTKAYPSQKWIAERARSSDRTVRRKLNELEEAGVIARGDQELVSHYVADRRPVVWDICYEITAGQSDRPDTGDQTTGHPGPNDRTPVSDKPSSSTSYLKPSKNQTLLERENELFDEWWEVYPRKNDKTPARKSYSKALKAVNGDHQILLEGAKNYAKREAGTPAEFLRYPSTWLNKETWQDYTGSNQDEASSQVKNLVEQGEISGLYKLTGVQCPPPEIPEGLSREARSEWNREHFKNWANHNMDRLVKAASHNSRQTA